jgi:butyrate kinase
VNPPLILAVNPGTGSTKLALFRAEARAAEEKLIHAELMQGPAARVWEELAVRVAAVRTFLVREGIRPGDLAAVVGRGGLLPPLPSGTYAVDAAMLRDLEKAERGEHASNLGAAIAAAIAREHGCAAFIVDPVSVDELDPVARVSGLDGMERRSFSHALNLRAVARRFARDAGRPLQALRLIGCHMGTGISLAAFRDGRMVDVVNPQDEGPFSGDRAGGLPATALVELCFERAAAGEDAAAVRRGLFGDGGLHSHLGTRDAREAVRRAEAGDARAALVLNAMAYQTAKAVGALATVLAGRIDAVLLTGGMVHLEPVVEAVERRIAWIAPVRRYPGEDELAALAEGALGVVRGEEQARSYQPAG